MNEFLSVVFSAAFVASVLRVTTPVLLAATGGLISEVAGVPNIILEGAMLGGACAGALVAGYSGNTGLGLAAAIAVGAVVGLALGVLHLQLRANPIISGIGLNLLASGLTAFIVFSLLGDKSGTSDLGSHQLPTVRIAGVRELPFIGKILSGQNMLTYAAFVLWAVVTFMLARSRAGIRLRACGEMIEAARSVGVRVSLIRYTAVGLSGAFAGAGGAFLSMGYVSYFVRDMTAGRGFIAVAAIFLGRKRPVGTLLACLLFGLTEALSIRLGNFNVPSQLVSAIPYAATFVALGVFAWRQSRPIASTDVPAGDLVAGPTDLRTPASTRD